MMLISAMYGVCVTVVARLCDVSLSKVFAGFKADLPWPTMAALSLSHFIWSDHVWMAFVPACILWPLLIPLVPAPQLPESRRVIIRTLRLAVFFVCLSTGVVIAIAIFTPMVALVHSVSQKH
jgi:hypothetical protein